MTPPGSSELVAHMLLAITDRDVGRWLFAAVFVILIVWLALVPAERLGESPQASWWRSPRLWAIAIASTQVLVYLWLG